MFAPPLNTWHELHNGQSNARAFPGRDMRSLAMNLYHNLDFIFNNPFVFRDRYQATPDYFSGPGKIHSGRIWETNFIADVYGLEPPERKERGRGNREFLFELRQHDGGPHLRVCRGTVRKRIVMAPVPTSLSSAGKGIVSCGLTAARN